MEKSVQSKGKNMQNKRKKARKMREKTCKTVEENDEKDIFIFTYNGIIMRSCGL